MNITSRLDIYATLNALIWAGINAEKFGFKKSASVIERQTALRAICREVGISAVYVIAK